MIDNAYVIILISFLLSFPSFQERQHIAFTPAKIFIFYN